MMAEETRQESGPEQDGCCKGDKGHRHHHKHQHGWHGGAMGGPLWCIGWLFTIGYLHMPFFWKGVLALLIWPYYLGSSIIH
jgi:hypothetical protein